LGLTVLPALAAESLDVRLLYLKQRVERPPALSNIQPPAADSGIAGARLGVSDSNTTGRFLNHHYTIEIVETDSATEAVEAARAGVNQGITLLLADLPAATLLKLSGNSDLGKRSIIFNTTAPDDHLRSADCRAGVLHTLPSRAMLTDALAQFLVARRWNRWLLLRGERAEDGAWVTSMRRSAKRFGGKIIDEKQWSFDTDLRRTAQQELPLFTQGKDYHVTLVADEIGDVGEYVPYNTWLPRPVAGTQGLTPKGWHGVVEQWGAQQLQNRFHEHSDRAMDDRDYAAWVAVRAIAEAVTRTQSTDTAILYTYLLSDEFEIAAFKGRSLTFRNWNGQLRQPIPLVQPRAVVSQSPQPGFLHPRTELDTLGFDEPETDCNFESHL